MAPAASIRRRRRTTTDESSDDSNSLIPALGRDLSINCLIRCPRAYYGKVAALNKSFRSLVRSNELYKQRRIAGIAETWIYMCCRSLQWEAFDPLTIRWFRLPRMPEEPCFMNTDQESLAVGNELMVIGREIKDMAIYKYTPNTNKWTTDNPPMNTRRCLYASASAGTIAYVAGGVTIRGEILTSAEMYDSEKGTWTVLPGGLKRPRKKCAGVMMDGKFYVMGGFDPDRVQLTSAEVYDPKTETWEEIVNMCPPVSGPTGVPPWSAVVKNELYAGEAEKMELWKYVKERNVWVTIGRLPGRVKTMFGWGVGFRACGDRLLVIGGPFGHYGMVQIYSWVPPTAVGDGSGGDELPPPPQWEVIAATTSGTSVTNCAIMSC